MRLSGKVALVTGAEQGIGRAIAVRAREIPLGRMAQPEEIARVAVFLATSDARWITDELIHVNGGFYMA